MDIIDFAQDLDRKFQEQSLNVHLKSREVDVSQHPEQIIIDGIHYCLDCDDEIPPDRIEAKPDALRCVYCQTRKERK